MNTRLRLMPAAALLAVGFLLTFVGVASAVVVPAPENPTLVLTITTCFDPADTDTAAAGFDVTNPANEGGSMNVTVDVPGAGQFSNASLPDGQTQTGGMGGLQPGDYVATATTTDGGTSGPVPFTIETCPTTDPDPESNPGSSFDTGVEGANTQSGLWAVVGATATVFGIGVIARTRRRASAR